MADTDNPVTLTIRLERGASPIVGVVVVGEEEKPFVGWLELTGLIETGYSTGADSSDQQPPTPG